MDKLLYATFVKDEFCPIKTKILAYMFAHSCCQRVQPVFLAHGMLCPALTQCKIFYLYYFSVLMTEYTPVKSNYWPRLLILLLKTLLRQINTDPLAFYLQYFFPLLSFPLFFHIMVELLKSMGIKWCQCLNWPSRGRWVHWLCSSATAGPLPQQRYVSAAEARVWFRDFQYTSNTLCYTESLLQP